MATVRLLMARAVLVLHAGFLVFLTLGILVVAWWLPAALLHVPVVAWGVYITVVGKDCPLTDLEKRYLESSGRESYRGRCTDRYLFDRLPDRLAGVELKPVITYAVLGTNLIGYLLLILLRV